MLTTNVRKFNGKVDTPLKNHYFAVTFSDIQLHINNKSNFDMFGETDV